MRPTRAVASRPPYRQDAVKSCQGITETIIDLTCPPREKNIPLVPLPRDYDFCEEILKMWPLRDRLVRVDEFHEHYRGKSSPVTALSFGLRRYAGLWIIRRDRLLLAHNGINCAPYPGQVPWIDDLSELYQYLGRARSYLATLQPDELLNEDLDEVDAIVKNMNCRI
ncbi:Dihydromethanopterin reductase (acceptor) [Frankliniella fusca]|uniref:Dihydromethanopterin reductase (Acceptor) n=1 Tax=Frankliniella fusca TaxID=407009 RepID=A0AAE1LAQ9_9NEOP|nr:Dihydromethanopterin reductase (acceptor) [Frankliniella fusca]